MGQPCSVRDVVGCYLETEYFANTRVTAYEDLVKKYKYER